ncbi:glycerol kinase GlpK [Mesoterricola sediminis]|uniref:Glycerol kinase n=1 Tax=Mesoterricola sediminis TaxID=2927980 RepID=A0AA48KDL6_9BACT|nr:glycerol kinase GlpK [Mesoterricola sediminis]BDU78336.1 glycerol kinase [Mesoterricola sediminis]
MSFVLALDQGTTSSRALLFDGEGAVRSVAQKEFAQHFPRPGWVEHDAREIWETQLATAREALAAAGARPRDVAAVGITNQRETTVLWDRATGEPLAPAIVWQDRRTAGLCEELRTRGLGPLFQERTGLVLDAYFSGTKLKWLLDEIPGARARAERGELAFGTIDAWLAWNLTGRHVTDPSNASRTLLFDIHRNRWDEELLGILDIPAAVLPAVADSSGPLGTIRPELFGGPLTLAGMAGDQQAATFGQACLEPGMAKNTYGTGCFMLMNTGDRPVLSRNRLLSTTLWKVGDRLDYALEGSVFMAGAAVQWLRDGLGIIATSAEVEPLARSVPDSGGVFHVPAFTGLGAPWWDPAARGAFFGLTRGSHKGHLARAVLESIAYQTADLLTAMEADSGIRLRELRVDGGASRNDLLMQFQADVLGVTVVRPRVTETTALGAAYLAGLAVGFWDTPEQLARNWRPEARFEPTLDATERSARLDRWHRAVARAKDWAD